MHISTENVYYASLGSYDENPDFTRYQLLRFYSDGVVLSDFPLLDQDFPFVRNKILGWFHRDNWGGDTPKGNYAATNSEISFWFDDTRLPGKPRREFSGVLREDGSLVVSERMLHKTPKPEFIFLADKGVPA